MSLVNSFVFRVEFKDVEMFPIGRIGDCFRPTFSSESRQSEPSKLERPVGAVRRRMLAFFSTFSLIRKQGRNEKH